MLILISVLWLLSSHHLILTLEKESKSPNWSVAANCLVDCRMISSKFSNRILISYLLCFLLFTDILCLATLSNQRWIPVIFFWNSKFYIKSAFDVLFLRDGLELHQRVARNLKPIFISTGSAGPVSLNLTLHVRVIHVVTDVENVYAYNLLGKQELTTKNSEILHQKHLTYMICSHLKSTTSS